MIQGEPAHKEEHEEDFLDHESSPPAIEETKKKKKKKKKHKNRDHSSSTLNHDDSVMYASISGGGEQTRDAKKDEENPDEHIDKPIQTRTSKRSDSSNNLSRDASIHSLILDKAKEMVGKYNRDEKTDARKHSRDEKAETAGKYNRDEKADVKNPSRDEKAEARKYIRQQNAERRKNNRDDNSDEPNILDESVSGRVSIRSRDQRQEGARNTVPPPATQNSSTVGRGRYQPAMTRIHFDRSEWERHRTEGAEENPADDVTTVETPPEPTYPALDTGTTYPDEVEDDVGPIVQAFVAATIDAPSVDEVDAIVVISPREEIEQEVKRSRRRGISVAMLIVAIVVSIIVPITITQLKTDSGDIPIAAVTDQPSYLPSTSPSAAPTSQSLVDVIMAVSDITSMDTFLNLSSPQYRAAQFMADWDPNGIRPTTDPRFLQRYALATLHYATNADKREGIDISDVVMSNWLDDSDECEWRGVICDSNNFMSHLDLQKDLQSLASFGLTGTLPEEIGFLSTLTVIQLGNSVITPGFSLGIGGTIPTSFARLSNLRQVYLWGNSFTSPIPDEWLAKASSLEYLLLNDNEFQGTINTQFTSLSNLIECDLYSNSFTGAIPEGFGKLNRLTSLYLADNTLASSIPEDLYDAIALRFIWMHDNQLTGTISSKIGQLTNLRTFDVAKNNMTKSIPPELYGIDTLRDLNLATNDFSGPILNDFASNSLRTVELQENGFSGTIPPIFANSTRLNTLLLHENTFSGSMPAEICDKVGENIFLDILDLTADCDEVICLCCTQCYP